MNILNVYLRANNGFGCLMTWLIIRWVLILWYLNHEYPLSVNDY